MNQGEKDLWIVSSLPPSIDAGNTPASRGAVVFKDHVSPKLLQEQLAEFAKGMGEALEGIREIAGGFELQEVEVHAEVSADGKVSLLGSGASAGVKGGLKLVFKRRPAGKAREEQANEGGA